MIIEFSGLPRSGKSTSIAVLRDVLIRSGYIARLNAERAQSCPFSSIHRVEFATWTANQALSDVLEAKYALPPDNIFLQDRGIFDALAFFRLLRIENRINQDDFLKFAGYIANRKWTNLVDLVIVFYVDPDVALKRDLASSIRPDPGVITNRQTLLRLTEAFRYTDKKYGNRFPKIVSFNTTDVKPLDMIEYVVGVVESLISPPQAG